MPRQILTPRPAVQLRNFNASGLNGLTVADFKYSPFKQPTFPAASILETGPRHPLWRKTKEQHENRDPNSLWSIISAHTIKGKKVVRTTCMKKFRKGFKQVLNEHGFDEDGKPLSGTGPFLKGTLTLSVKLQILTANQSQVKQEASLIVQELMRRNEIVL